MKEKKTISLTKQHNNSLKILSGVDKKWANPKYKYFEYNNANDILFLVNLIIISDDILFNLCNANINGEVNLEYLKFKISIQNLLLSLNKWKRDESN